MYILYLKSNLLTKYKKMANKDFFARKSSINIEEEKEETSSKKISPMKIGIIAIIIIIAINLISSWFKESKKNKLIQSEKDRQTYLKNIVSVEHKINANETVFFDFGEIIRNRIVKIKGDGDNVRLNFKYFPSGIEGYYTDDHRDTGTKDYTDSGVYVTSSKDITLKLSLL